MVARLLAIAGCTLLAGCSCAKLVKQETAPLVARIERVTKQLDALEAAIRKPAVRGGKQAKALSPPAASIPGGEERLFGTWVSDQVMTKAGPTVNTVTFRDDGTVRIVTDSTLPLMGTIKTTEGPFEVDGDTLVSESIEGGTKVKFWFEGETLVIRTKDDTLIRLNRS